jgi:hypothetical protein
MITIVSRHENQVEASFVRRSLILLSDVATAVTAPSQVVIRRSLRLGRGGPLLPWYPRGCLPHHLDLESSVKCRP